MGALLMQVKQVNTELGDAQPFVMLCSQLLFDAVLVRFGGF